MQIFSAKSLIQKFQSRRILERRDHLPFFAQEIFYAAAGRGLPRRINRRASLFLKTSLNWGKRNLISHP